MVRFLPPRDLLEQVEGIERGLRRGRRVRLFGVLLAAVQGAVLVTNDQWFQELADDELATVDGLLLFGSVFLLILAVLLASWTRFWLHESRQPFRYTYTIAPFTPVDGDAEQALLVPLHADLQERLSMRIRRLSRLAERSEPAEQPGAGDAESHLHISGEYAVRRRPPDPRWFVEISPWVRVGGPDRPATLGVPVKYWIVAHKPGVADTGRYPPELDAQHYEEILERAYFSIATEIYRRIREDVSDKIALLPSRWFRASALFHEAQDYARSNTLDAYEEAAKLYAATLDIYDPGSAPPPRSGIRRPVAFVWRLAMRALAGARCAVSYIVPRLGRAEVLAARAQVGYANTLLDTAVLAPLSGLQARAVFEAAPIAQRAVGRLRWLSADVSGRDDTCFDANVALAFARVQLNARSEARAALARAWADQPSRADQDPRFVFVRAELEDRLLARQPLYQRAVELEPRFEAAQFQLASTSEMLWRARPTLERSVAETVLRQYREVLRLNPGNVSAWANSAYMWWLLGDLSQARQFYEGGRRLKEIKPQAFVAELDHGLARIAAEQGRFEEAYDHAVQAVAAMIAQVWSRGSYEEYQFRRFTRAMLDRFTAYRDAAAGKRKEADDKGVLSPTRRVRESVFAFVLYDYSQACRHYYLQTNDYAELQHGLAACREALECNPRFVLATYNLYKLEREQEEEFAPGDAPSGRRLDRLEELEPGWPEAALSQLTWNDTEAARLRAAAAEDRTKANRRAREADELEDELLGKREYTGFGSTPTPSGGPDGEHGGYERVGRLRAEAARLRARARERDERAQQREDRARDLPRRLLPHQWLWSARGFRWRVVRSRGARRQLLWERNLEAFHVRALFAWCRFLSDKPGGQHRLDRLLDLVETRFWPADLDLLELRHKRANGAADPWTRWTRPEAAKGYRDRIDEVVNGILIRDGDPFEALRRLDRSGKDSTAALIRVAHDRDRTAYLHHWVGERLLARWRSTMNGDKPDHEAREAAVIALQRAIEIDQPDAVLKLADQLDELGYPQAREPLYEAAVKSSGTARQLVELAERYERIRSFRQLPHLYREAEAREAAGAERHDSAFYRARIAAALFACGDHRGALAELRGIDDDGGSLGRRWRAGLAGRMLEIGAIGDRDAQLRVRAWLGATQRTAIAAGDVERAEDAAEAAQELARGPHGAALWRRPEDDVDHQLPILLPVIVEGDQPTFYPQEGETEQVARMIDTDIPAIRSAIEQETGIFIPGFRISSSHTVGDRGYRILIHEVEVERGVVPDVDDPHLFMLERAARAIRARLSSFVDMQSLEALVDQWIAANGEDGRALAARARDTEPKRRALLTLVKLLVADGVRIADLGPVLDAIATATIPGADLRRLATSVRADMAGGIRARELTAVRITQALEAELERSIPQDGDSAPFELPDAVLDQLRDELRGLSRPQSEVALVVRSPGVRAAIAELVAPALSGILVASQDEVAAGTRSRGSWIVVPRKRDYA
jgi:hypothetical protein